MRYIPKETPFQVVGIIFGLQPKTAGDSVSFSMSIDGVTFTAPSTGGTFNGCTIFDSFPNGLWLYCDKDVFCTENVAQSLPETATVTCSTPKGRVLIRDPRSGAVWDTTTSQTNSATVPVGTRLIIEVINYWDADHQTFDRWTGTSELVSGSKIKEAAGAGVNPYEFVVTGNTTLTANFIDASKKR